VSIAYRNDNYIGEQIFPVIPVQKQADKYFKYTKADWFRNEAGPRAPGTIGPEGGYTLSTDSYSCVPIAFTKVVTDEEENNSDDPLQPQRTAVEFATDKLLLYHEVAVAGLVFGAGTWAASATPATTWDNPASDPMSDIETGKESLVGSIGREPNVCVMGREVWTDLRRHPDLLDLFKYTRKGMLTVAEFADMFEFPKVLIGTAIYATLLESQMVPASGVLTASTQTYTKIWGKSMWIGWVPPNASLGVPAAGYTFAWKSRTVEAFRREEEKSTAYRVEYNVDVKATATDAGYEFISCVA